jgi:CDP-paratose 2-epimerase
MPLITVLSQVRILPGPPVRAANSDGSSGAQLCFAYWPHFQDYAGLEAVLADLERLAPALPSKVVRLGVSWADWARTGEGPAWLDELIGAFHGAGTEIIPTIMWTPPSFGRIPYSNAPPRDVGTFAWFVDHFLERHGDRIGDHVQLWSEVNGYCYWDRGTDPAFTVFAEMYRYAAELARERHGKQVVLPGIIPRGGIEWVELMGTYGLLEHTDVVALHGFPGTWLRRRIGWHHLLARLQSSLRFLGAPRPIWITEASFSTSRTHARRSPRAEYMQLRLLRDLLRLPVERVFWYTFHDLPPDRPAAVHTNGGSFDPREHGCGLRYADGAAKLLYNVLLEAGPDAIRQDRVPSSVLCAARARPLKESR